MTAIVTVTEDIQKQKPEDKDAEKFVKERLELFRLSKEASTDDRNARVGDLKFRAGDQWPDNIMQDRANETRPCLTINQLPHFIRLVTNDMRQNRAAPTVSPTDGDATKETAEVIQGMIRHIEYDSNADFAYDTAADAQCTHGLGFFRVVTQYECPMSFDQVLKIKRIRNPFSVFHDPASQEPDMSDAKWFFIIEDMTREVYEANYPDSKLAATGAWDGIGLQLPDWLSKDACRVAEHFYVKTEKKKIWLLDNREVVLDSDLEYDGETPKNPTGRSLMGSRMAIVPTIKWCKMNAVEILEETEWMGKWIPIIPVMGDEIDLDGKVVYEGIVRHAKDSQRMYNYWASAETETIALAPKAPWVGAEGQFAGHETKWRESNRRNFAYLEYKVIPGVDGQPVGPPQRNIAEPPVRAITQAREIAGKDIQNTTGTFDPAMGKQGNETSGAAIIARQNRHGITNFHYPDNMARSIRHLGRILVDLIPKIYDTKRVVRIIHPDGESETVTVNGQFTDEQGVERMYDVRKGKYDVIVSAGPSYQTKRQESVQTMLQLAMAYPPLVQAAGDLMVGNMDWPGANEIAERLKKLLPPGLQDGSDISPAAHAQMQQMQGLIQQLTHALNKTSAKLESKVMDVESKERIALNKSLTDLVIAAEQMHHEKSNTAFTTIVQHLENQLDRVGEGQDPEIAAQQGAAQLNPTAAQASGATGQEGGQPLQQSPQPMQNSNGG